MVVAMAASFTEFLLFRTENTALLAGLGRAAELVADHVSSYSSSMSAVRDYLEEKLQVRTTMLQINHLLKCIS